MRRNYFSQQNDTKINDFDEAVLILEPFFWVNVIFKICFFCIKSHDRGREEFLWVASPDCNTAKFRNKCFSLFTQAVVCLRFSKQEQTLYPGEPNNGKFRYVNCDFWDRRGKFWKLHCLGKTAIESKRLHQNQWSWCHFAKKRNFFVSLCPLFSWNYWS